MESYLSVVRSFLDNTFCKHSERFPNSANKKPTNWKWISYAEQSERPIIMGSREKITNGDVLSCRINVDIKTVKMGAELFIISAKDTGMYQSAIKASDIVKNLRRKKNKTNSVNFI